jgi:hypothetical protein
MSRLNERVVLVLCCAHTLELKIGEDGADDLWARVELLLQLLDLEPHEVSVVLGALGLVVTRPRLLPSFGLLDEHLLAEGRDRERIDRVGEGQRAQSHKVVFGEEEMAVR